MAKTQSPMQLLAIKLAGSQKPKSATAKAMKKGC